MLQQEKFWEVEGDAPLMGKNRGFLKPNADTTKQIAERVSKWPSVISNDANKTSGFDKWELKGEPERIFVKDAERTFFGPDNRQNLIKVLSFLHEKFGDYHQGLSYVTSFLLLTLDVNSTINILVRMNEDQKYIPGYWRAEAVAFATDAYVFDSLLLKHFPQVYAHLAKNYIFPETYAQKWFIGLCVHVLPFEALFLFVENFLTHGYQFLFQFGLSLIKHTQEQILKATTQAAIYSILRLDTKEEELSLSIVKEALNYDVSDVNFVEVRKKVFDEKLKARLERAAQFKEKAKEESDDEIGSDEEDGEGEECMLCKENMPEYYCPTCKVLVCESCHKAGKAPHQKGHKVKPMDEVDMDTLTKEISSLSINKKKGKGKDSASDEEDD